MKKTLLFVLIFGLFIFKLNAQYYQVSTNLGYGGDASECDIDISNSYAVSNLLYIYPIQIYSFSGGNWNLHQQIYLNSCPISIGYTFYAEKLSLDLEGDILVVGVQNDSLDYSGLNPLSNSGSVLIYSKKPNGLWSFDQKLSASNRTVDLQFGVDVAVDGNDLLIKSKSYIYCFRKNSSGIWVQDSMISAVETSNIAYHYQNLISIDSNILVFGFYTNSTIKVYEKVANNWQFSANLLPPDGGVFKDCYVKNNTIYIGNPENSYDSASTNFISGAGAVFIYKKNLNGVWTIAQKIVSPNRTAGGGFGAAISVSNNRLAIGAPQEGNVVVSTTGSGTNYDGAMYVYKDSNSNYNYYSTISNLLSEDNLSSCVAIDDYSLIMVERTKDIYQFNTSWGENLAAFRDTSFILYQTTISIDTCKAYTNQFGQTYSKNGYYNHIIHTSLGDSIYNFNVTIDRDSSFVNIVACDSFVSPSGNIVAYTSGLYSDTLAGINNCDSVVYYNVVFSVIDTSVTTIVALNGEVTLISNSTNCNYLWFDCINNAPTNNGNDTLQIFNAQPITGFGSYAVIISRDGCQDTSNCHTVIVNGLESDIIANNSIDLYPNPSKGYFYVQSKRLGKAELAIFDTQGKNILTQQLKFKYSIPIKISTSALAKGIYFVRIKNAEGIFTSKIIIE